LQKNNNNNILATIAAIVLLGSSISSNNQLFVEGLPQSQNTSNIMNKSFPNPVEDRRTLAFNQTNDTTKMSTSELAPASDLGATSLSIIQRVINELGNATSDEIATYPINDLSPEVLVKVLNGLSVDNLYKVLRNLTQDDLKSLLVDKLTPEQSKQILERLPQDKKVDIENRRNI
jgi:hypothetical protein